MSTVPATNASLDFRKPSGGRTVKNTLATVYVSLAAVLAIVPLVWILWSVISKGIHLILDSNWWLQSQRGITPRREGGGAYHAIVGTVEIGLICAPSRCRSACWAPSSWSSTPGGGRRPAW